MKNILEYKGYHAKIEFSSDDNIFIGSVIGINDSLNFHGTTVDELPLYFSQLHFFINWSSSFFVKFFGFGVEKNNQWKIY